MAETRSPFPFFAYTRPKFGFDDTYVDLSKALTPTIKGGNYVAFAEARQSLEKIIGGRLEYDVEHSEWKFKNGKNKYDISLTSEGIKKLSILDLLLGNHYLTNKSIIIIDEVEANLHPDMIRHFLEIIVMLAQAGIQFFLSTHSYFVIKNLYIMAHQKKMHIPTFSFEKTCPAKRSAQRYARKPNHSRIH